MQTNNSFLKIFLVLTALALFMAWSIAPAVAQAGSMGGSNKGNRGTTTGDTLNQRGTDGTMDHDGSRDGSTQRGQTGVESQIGMNRYLVMIPHTGTGTCQDVMKDFSSTNRSSMGGSSNMGGSSTDRDNDRDNDRDMDNQSGSSTRGQTGTYGNQGNQPGTYGNQPGQTGTYGSMSKSGIWQWGCSTDDQTLYLFTNAPSEEAALREVPSNLRSEAKVIQMTNFGSQVGMPGSMQNKPSGSSGQKKY